jgi:hypothetical protein
LDSRDEYFKETISVNDPVMLLNHSGAEIILGYTGGGNAGSPLSSDACRVNEIFYQLLDEYWNNTPQLKSGNILVEAWLQAHIRLENSNLDRFKDRGCALVPETGDYYYIGPDQYGKLTILHGNLSEWSVEQ